MGYKLVSNHWLERQVALCRSICIKHLDPDTEYTQNEFLAILAEYETYTPSQMVAIRDELIVAGIIEEV